MTACESVIGLEHILETYPMADPNGIWSNGRTSLCVRHTQQLNIDTIIRWELLSLSEVSGRVMMGVVRIYI